MLRSNYGKCMLELMAQMPGAPQPAAVGAVLDLGCAAGLSSLALRQLFPAAHITGIDLSPHMVAVGRYHQQQREVSAGCSSAWFIVGSIASPAHRAEAGWLADLSAHKWLQQVHRLQRLRGLGVVPFPCFSLFSCHAHAWWGRSVCVAARLPPNQLQNACCAAEPPMVAGWLGCGALPASKSLTNTV